MHIRLMEEIFGNEWDEMNEEKTEKEITWHIVYVGFITVLYFSSTFQSCQLGEVDA